jgi:asparagine synthase (glutamine-hydrolysing)
MAGIAGVDQLGKEYTVKKMLSKISHRGNGGWHVQEVENATFGLVYTGLQKDSLFRLKRKNEALDGNNPGHQALVKAKEGGLVLKRDPLGVAPLYYGEDDEGSLYFASEVKALVDFCSDIQIVPPGCKYDGEQLTSYFKLKEKLPLDDAPDIIADDLKRLIVNSIERRVEQKNIVGCWLSGGLDSSALAALCRPRVKNLYTFVAGLEGSPDLENAKEVARFIDSEHHELVVSFADLVLALPDVIFHLESFDALLVRSSLVNYLVAKRTSEYVDSVLSGEGGDELFAGYHYLKCLAPEELQDELIDITQRLHNTALQRVDRNASAYGVVAHVCYLDPEIVDYALRIPMEYKLLDNRVEKWILRKALADELPKKVLDRKKVKFWEGAGVGEYMLDYADITITDEDFRRERILRNGWKLNSKEELLYYRIFKEYFGEQEDYSWMGRTKSVPVNVA